MSADRHFASLKAIVPAVSRETADRLIAFEELFRKWSKAINLASPSTLNELWTRHILDSAQLFPWQAMPDIGWILARAAGFRAL